jgi:hypothetical protein
MSVTNFVEIMVRMAKYYSIKQGSFESTPIPDSKAKKACNRYSKDKYFKKLDRTNWLFRHVDSFQLNLKAQSCTCKFFLKSRICGHLMALNKLKANDEFVKKPKRGGQKKAKGALVRM